MALQLLKHIASVVADRARKMHLLHASVMCQENHCLHATASQYLSELCTLVADVASQRHL